MNKNTTVPATPLVGVRSRVAAMLDRGMDIAGCARELNLPEAFVEQIVESLNDAGAIDLMRWRDARGCGPLTCNPDPDSPLCAGCPLKPIGIKRQTHNRSNAETRQTAAPRRGLWRHSGK